MWRLSSGVISFDVIVCADENGGWDNIQKVDKTGETAVIIFGMDYNEEYKLFIQWITDPENSGIAGPLVYTREEDAFARLFAAYLNCRYPPAPSNHPAHTDGQVGGFR